MSVNDAVIHRSERMGQCDWECEPDTAFRTRSYSSLAVTSKVSA